MLQVFYIKKIKAKNNRGGEILILQIEDEFDAKQNRWKVRLEGEADVYTVNNLKERLHKLLEKQIADIEMDCDSLQYIDSTGLGTLIGIRGKLSTENKKLILINLQPNVRKLLKITGLDKIFIVQ